MGKAEKCRSIKALVVEAELTVQKIGTIQVAAPLGVKVDHRTGELETPVELKLVGQPVFTPTIIPGKIINHGLQKACLVVKEHGSGPCRLSARSTLKLDIPIDGMHDVPHIKPGDHAQEQAEVESIDIRGIRDPNHQGCGEKNILMIKVVYQVKIVICREETISVPEHCHRDSDRCWIQETGPEDAILNKNDINIIVRPFQRSNRKS